MTPPRRQLAFTPYSKTDYESQIRHGNLLKIKHLQKTNGHDSFMLHRSNLMLAMLGNLFHNTPMLHCNILLVQD